MKIRHLLVLGIALVIPHFGSAKVPMPAQSLGQIESILDFCANVNPQDTSRYLEFKKMTSGTASDDELTETRGTKEYKNSYQAESDELAKQPKQKAVKACSSLFQSDK